MLQNLCELTPGMLKFLKGINVVTDPWCTHHAAVVSFCKMLRVPFSVRLMEQYGAAP